LSWANGFCAGRGAAQAEASNAAKGRLKQERNKQFRRMGNGTDKKKGRFRGLAVKASYSLTDTLPGQSP
jgi:hypothetical protein